MDHASRIGNPKTVEIFAQRFDFVTARDAIYFQIRGAASVSLVSSSSQIRGDLNSDAINPQSIRAELKKCNHQLLLQ